MTANRDQKLRDQLREAYDSTALEREGYEMQEWKIRLRADFTALLQREKEKSLLEIGAGTGRDSLFFKEQGLEPVCIDLSPAMIELCKKKGLEAYEMDMADLAFPEASFNAAYAMNSLLHIPKAEFLEVLGQVNRVLKPGGVFFMGVYGGYDHEGIYEKDAYTPQRFFSFYEDSDLQKTAESVFEIYSFQRIDFDASDPIHFQALILRKRSEPVEGGER